jgi:hypothetical protein
MRRRLGLWILVPALPLAALGLLAAAPHLDVRWEHHPSHFWPGVGWACRIGRAIPDRQTRSSGYLVDL